MKSCASRLQGVILSTALLLLQLIAVVNGQQIERPIQFENRSGKRIEVHWIHPQTKEMVLQSSPHIMNGATLSLNSFVGHTFQLRELPSSKTGECGDEGSESKQCRTDMVTVTSSNEQVVFIGPGFVVSHADTTTKAKDEAGTLISRCQHIMKMKLSESPNNNAFGEEEVLGIVDDLVQCIEGGVSAKILQTNEEIVFQEKIRKSIAAKWENYTCADLEAESTEPTETAFWIDPKAHTQHKVSKYLDRDASKIFSVENFISQDECRAMEKAAESTLHRASVADSKGGSTFSEARKAMQAGIKVNWGHEAKGDPIAALSRRVYEFTNSMTGYNLSPEGQEDLMSIQYFGSNYEAGEPPDRYTPHCDGECTGLEHKDGTRVATMVMYCDIPEVGGATQFRNSGVHLEPKVGMATFFSYLGSDGKMDTGFTEHSGCPVLKGDKKIVTQWMRKGVSIERPWDSFNTLGVHRSEEQD